MIYRISSEAERDLGSIWAYTAKRWEPEQADTYIDTLVGRFAWLTRNRPLWQVRSDIREGVYAYPEQSHAIFFRTWDGGIEILRVLHRRMDFKRHL